MMIIEVKRYCTSSLQTRVHKINPLLISIDEKFHDRQYGLGNLSIASKKNWAATFQIAEQSVACNTSNTIKSMSKTLETKLSWYWGKF